VERFLRCLATMSISRERSDDDDGGDDDGDRRRSHSSADGKAVD
jgi:hypothetical protein